MEVIIVLALYLLPFIIGGSINTDSQNQIVTDLAAQFDQLEIRASDDTVLVTFSISWGTASGGSISVTGTPISQSASNTGTASKARLNHSTNPEAITDLSVGTSGTEVTLNTTEIESGKSVDLDSATLTAPTTT